MNQGNSFLFDRWPRIAARNPKRVLGAALAVIAALIAVNTAVGGTFVDRFSIPGTESQAAVDLLEDRFPQQSGGAATIVVRAERGIDSPEVRAEIESLITEFAKLPHVLSVTSPYDTPGSISPSGNVARFSAQYDEQPFDLEVETFDALFDLRDESSRSDFQVELGGAVPSAGEVEPPGEAELIGLGMAVLVLLVAFGSVVAMGLPITTALLGLIPGFMIIGLLSAFVDMASFTPQFASMIGIGVGIDYALLIVTRFREGLVEGKSLEDAIAQSSATAGRAVLFAGTVVVIALLGLWASGIPFLGWVATAAAILVASLVAVALLVLPAVLGLVGAHIDRFTLPIFKQHHSSDETGFATRWANAVQRRPVVFLLISLAIVVTLALPISSLRLGSADAGSNPESATTRRAYDLLSDGFGPGFNGQILVALQIDDPAAIETVEGLPDRLVGIEGVVATSPVIINEDQSAAIITVIPTSAPQEVETSELVERLRDEVPGMVAGSGAEALIGGQTAAFEDIAEKISTGLPIFIPAVLGLSFILLMAVFRSIVIPLKASVMVLASVSVAFGVLVAIFQWGWLGGLIGVDKTGPVESFLPMMLFAVLFGLSMDYEVFLVTRMQEEFQKTKNNAIAVARGQAVTMRVIIAAALIMSSVFFSFTLVDFRVIKEFGLGLGVAILIDALVVRMMLVPSIMHLFGARTWWFPRWLDRILPRITVEAETAPAATATETAGD